MLRSLFLLLFVCVSGVAMAQTSGIAGVLKDERGEPVASGSVTVTQGGINRGGAVTDFDGNFVIKPLDAGLYDVKFSYQGKSQTVTGVRVTTDAVSTLNHKMVTARDATNGKEVVVRAVGYKGKPLIDPRNPGGSSVKTSADIENSGNSNISDIASLSTQTYQSKNGQGLSLGGGRVGSGTLYVVDGVQLASGNASFTTPPQGSVDQVKTYVSGIPARYGDASGGVITITTKGVSAETRAGVRLQHSIDGYNNNLVSFNLSGPLLRKKDSTGNKRPVLGYALNGQGDFNKDDNPSYYKQYHLNSAKQSELEQTPLVVVPNSSGDPQNNYGTELVRSKDMEQQKRRQNVDYTRGGFNGKLVYALNDKVTVTAGGEFYLSQRSNYSAANVLFNAENNSQSQSKTGRGYIRLTQKFANAGTEGKNNAISNAFYTIQADYQKDWSTTQDKNHKHNTFDYGYIGKFDQQYVPSFAPGIDTISGATAIRQVGYAPTGVNFTRSEVNPLLANYTSQYYQITDPNLRPNLISINDISRGYLRNGDRPAQVYGLYNSVGTPQASWSVTNNDQVAVQVDASFDLKHNRTTHSIEFGLYYQQRNERLYGITATSLWGAMRLLELAAVDGSSMDFSNPTYRINGRDYTAADVKNGLVTPGPHDTVFYTRAGSSDSARSAFDRNLRKKLGVGKNDYVNIDGLDPSMFSLDMFAPDELTIANRPFVNYHGYDHTGKRLTGQVNFADYWTQKDADGNYTRPIGAYRPNYIAGYISDYIQYKDFLISLGVRVERFDANTKVLRDPYSLIATRTVGDYVNTDAFKNAYPGFKLPANVSNGYIPYVGENASPTPTIIGYRNGDQWYDATGTEVQDPLTLSRNANTSNLQPLLQRNGQGRIINISDPEYGAADAEKSFVDYTPKVNVMPRINFSFPLNDNALFYAHYDVMVQRPTTGNYATAADYRYMIFQPASIIDNPDLKPERLIDYEVGFQQKLTEKSSVTLSGFYKERKDQIQIRQYYQAYPTTYFTYGNRDFSTSKGFSLNYELRRISNITMSVNYTLSFNEGTGSSATSANSGNSDVANTNGGLLSNYIGAGLPNMRNLFPLDYDSRHNINAQIDYRYLTGEGPTINGNHFLENAGANLIFRARSGEPYTRYAQPTAQPGGNGGLIAGAVNGSRLPWHYMFDLNIDKSFNLRFGKKEEPKAGAALKRALALNVFLYIQNLFNTRDVQGVYGYTGRAGDDGYLTSAQGLNQSAQQVDPQSYKDIYGLRQQDINQLNNPRRIVLGVKLNF